MTDEEKKEFEEFLQWKAEKKKKEEEEKRDHCYEIVETRTTKVGVRVIKL